MLPKKQRLTAAEVRAILKSGTSARGSRVSAKYVKVPGSKAAVVVSKKVAKTAVLRNRLRRMGYEALKVSLPSGLHLVLFVLSPEVQASDIATLCSRLS
jgi:ribonuclease P protein component